FLATYGIELKEIFGTLDLGISTYRFTLGKVIPQMTKVAWESKRSDIQKLSPQITRQKFVYALPARKYRAEWKDKYQQPGIGTRILAIIFRAIPTVGPFKFLSFKPVPDQAEKEFLQSFNETVKRYQAELTDIRNLKLANLNLDTGKPVHPGEYNLADKSYAELLDHLAKHNFADIRPELRKNIEDFYAKSDRSALPEKVQAHLKALAPGP